MLAKEALYRKVLLAWGEIAQINMAIEECAELIKAISKYKRNPYLLCNKQNLFEEIADVEIMIEQLRILYDEKEIDKVKQQKLERLEKLVKKC